MSKMFLKIAIVIGGILHFLSIDFSSRVQIEVGVLAISITYTPKHICLSQYVIDCVPTIPKQVLVC